MLSPKVKVTSNEDIRIVEMRGEFIGGDETDDLRDVLQKESQDGADRLLVDLSGATYLNSTALGVLISAHTSFSKRNAKIALCNVSKNIENIFVITKLALVFSIYSTRQEALEQMRNGR